MCGSFRDEVLELARPLVQALRAQSVKLDSATFDAVTELHGDAQIGASLLSDRAKVAGIFGPHWNPEIDGSADEVVAFESSLRTLVKLCTGD